MYFEARGESTSGKIAVATVTLNRVADKRWPNTICGVVWQRRQFSWTHDGLSDTPSDYGAWVDAKYVSNIAVQIYKVRDANHYHNLTVFPKWAAEDTRDYVGYMQNHIFYNK